jgi:lipoate-protein ligase A
MPAYRVIFDGAHPGTWNMAVDEVLLTTANASGLATLRFYRWSTPTLSLGYFQKYRDRASHIPSQGCPVVRRASGGGAIVHDCELTYSLTWPIQDRWSRATATLLANVHDSLIEVLRSLDLDCALYDGDGFEEGAFLCFTRRSRGDVIVGDHKVAGSAQRRFRGAVLQHGSVLLRSSAAAPSLVGLWDLARESWTPGQLQRVWYDALKRCLSVEFREGALASKELEKVKCLAKEKFGQESWLLRR